MKFVYNKTWIIFVAPEQQGKTYQTKRLINYAIKKGKLTEDKLNILDPNDIYKEYENAERIVLPIQYLTPGALDECILYMRSKPNCLNVLDDVDVFLKTGWESTEIDNLGKTIKQQNIGGILHTHRAKFFNSRIYGICDYVMVGYNLNATDINHLYENAGLDKELYSTLKPREFILIPQLDKKQQKKINLLGE